MAKKSVLLLLLLLLVQNGANAQIFFPGDNDAEACITAGCYYVILPFFFARASFNLTDAGNYFTLDCPYLDLKLLGEDEEYFQLTFCCLARWGLTPFFVDILLGGGAYFYPFAEVFDDPFGRVFNLHVRAFAGTFFLNNVMLRAETGVDLEFMVIDDTLGFYVSADAFIQGNWRVIAYIPDAAWFLNAMGFSFSFGLRADWEK